MFFCCAFRPMLSRSRTPDPPRGVGGFVLFARFPLFLCYDATRLFTMWFVLSPPSRALSVISLLSHYVSVFGFCHLTFSFCVCGLCLGSFSILRREMHVGLAALCVFVCVCLFSCVRGSLRFVDVLTCECPVKKANC